MSNHALVDNILDMVFEELNKVKFENDEGLTIYRIGQARWHDLRAKVHYFYGGEKKSKNYPYEDKDGVIRFKDEEQMKQFRESIVVIKNEHDTPEEIGEYNHLPPFMR